MDAVCIHNATTGTRSGGRKERKAQFELECGDEEVVRGAVRGNV
jgi:hypothetical protein